MVAIIVVSYKLNDLTVRFVENELSKISCAHKTVIVNNAGTDEDNDNLCTRLGARLIVPGTNRIPDSDIFVISNPDNSGYAKGNNIGARFCMEFIKPDLFLFSNPDIRFIDNDVVEKMASKLSTISEAGLIGPKIIGLDGKLQSPEPYHSFWDRHIWMHIASLFYSKKKKAERFKFDYPESAKEGFHYKLMGSFFMARASDFAHCGMMDEHTFLYSEETILSERMRIIGLRPYYYPEVSVIHNHGTTTSTFMKRREQSDLLFESELYYYSHYMKTNRIELAAGKAIHHLLKVIR